MATSSTDTGSALTHLQCTACGREHDADRLQTLCPDCGKVLFARYDLGRAARTLTREAVAARPRGMWRWRELLPVRDARNVISLGEGDSPLLPAPRLGALAGLKRLLVKDEGTNPTGSFKARGISAARVAGPGARREGRGAPHGRQRRRRARRLCRAGRPRGARLHAGGRAGS